ncbi:MAG: diguanylate cyclase/phosphodiesterase [Clostridiales bacterium]|nr:diguanylate cyclase/phosphodiesterase [Clostridiales bacterium]
MVQKRRVHYSKFCILFFLLISLFFIGEINVDASDQPKNVLILNSYQKGLSWTDDQTNGIVNILKESEIKCNIAVEYMDWKNYPTKENLDKLYEYLKYKYINKSIDLILTTDDAALDFALKNRKQIFSNAPIVFSGLNNYSAGEITESYENATGVFERIDPEKTIEAALKINPKFENVYVLFDDSESGILIGRQTINTINSLYPQLKVSTLNGKELEDVLNEVKQISGESIILITTYYQEGNGVVAGFEEFCRLVSQNSIVPVYNIFEFGIGNGVIGGSMVSGETQGENAGEMAVEFLNGTSISDIPMEWAKNTQFIFDYNELKRFNIPLSSIPKDSTIVNSPFSFFETYKSLVITVLIIISMLVTFIFILLFYLRKITRMKESLLLKNKELSELYEELSSTNETLKQQYNKLNKAQLDLVTSERKYSLLYEKMLNGFFIFEPVLNKENKIIDIRFINVNPGFSTQTRLAVRDIIGKTWTQAFGYPNRELEVYQNVLSTGEGERFETYYPDANVYYLVNAFKINDHQVGSVFDNITEYKLAIKEIKKLNEVLEQRVMDRTRELQKAVNELESFTYTVSHDLKSPLRAVDGYSRIIYEDYGEKLNEEVNEAILGIRTICNDMIEMINRLLEYSTTSRTELCKEVISFEEIFAKIFNELHSVENDREVKLIIETRLPKINADKIMIRQAVYNLLSNAFKFTKNQDKAVIHIGSTLTENEYIFYIKDNGVGFDMEFSSKLFGLFQRLHTSEEFEGSGIGLVTVKKIIEKHGGRVWIEGKVNEGTTVYFTLPFE